MLHKYTSNSIQNNITNQTIKIFSAKVAREVIFLRVFVIKLQLHCLDLVNKLLDIRQGPISPISRL